jgi:hypothetical protein
MTEPGKPMTTLRLKIGNGVTFDVRFALTDAAGQVHEYGFRAGAQRVSAASDGETVGALLERAQLTMEAWLGEAPLVDEHGADMPPGPEALAALFDQVSNAATIAYGAYLAAVQARAPVRLPAEQLLDLARERNKALGLPHS